MGIIEQNARVISRQESRIKIPEEALRLARHKKEPGLKATSDKYMWVSRGGPPGQTSVLFEYDLSRKKKVPLRLLEDFSGYLQTDGYSVYNAVCIKNNATSAGCWEHARRKFREAQSTQPRDKKTQKPGKADMALAQINKLYRIERTIKEVSVDEKLKVRQFKAADCPGLIKDPIKPEIILSHKSRSLLRIFLKLCPAATITTLMCSSSDLI